MRDFSFFLAAKDVKKQSPDRHLANALIKESEDRLKLAKDLAKTQKPKYTVENAYEAVRELIDAILYSEGYKSYSHEASIAYLGNLNFSATDVERVDRLRELRNGIKYRGEDASQEDATEALIISEKMIKKLMEKIEFKT